MYGGKGVLDEEKEETGEIEGLGNALLSLESWPCQTATHSSILAWEIPWSEKPNGLQSMGSQKSQTLPSKSSESRLCL